VQRWSPLNERQLAVLRRVDDGSDPVSAKIPELATTVYALRNRGLVTTPRRDGVWYAQITEAGRFYLEHGHHPDRPPPSDPARSPSAVGGRTSQPSRRLDRASELIEQLTRSHGTLRIEKPSQNTRSEYRRAIAAAKRRGLVPAGSLLLHTGRDDGDLIVRLVEKDKHDETEWNRIRLLARDELTGADLFTALEVNPKSVDVSETAKPRTVKLVRALVRTAERRGHVVAISRKSRQLYVRVRDHQYTFKICEEHDQVPRALPPGDWRLKASYPWQRITPPEYDSVPSGRLKIEFPGLGEDSPRRWVDEGRKKVEGSLQEIFEVLERKADQADEEQQARRRAHEVWLVEYEREQAEQDRRDKLRQAEWETVMAKARGLAVEDLRKKSFQNAVAGWAGATEIREFCAALKESAMAHDVPAVQDWLDWATAWADQLDPTLRPAQFAEEFDQEPEPDDLRPHLGDWSPHEPRKEYRPSKDPVQPPASGAFAAEAPAWIWVRRGRFPWWRL
jgi:hypothetical protein